METLFFVSSVLSDESRAGIVFSSLCCNCRRWFIQILLAQSSAQKKKKKIRNGDEFQQRGQKNSANSLQMCLRSVWGEHCAALTGEKKYSAYRRKFNELRAKKHQWPSTAGSDCLSGFPEKREEATQEHIVFALWRNCWYAESQECVLVIPETQTQSSKSASAVLYWRTNPLCYGASLKTKQETKGTALFHRWCCDSVWKDFCLSWKIFYSLLFTLKSLKNRLFPPPKKNKHITHKYACGILIQCLCRSFPHLSLPHEQLIQVCRETSFPGAHITPLGSDSPSQLTQAEM